MEIGQEFREISYCNKAWLVFDQLSQKKIFRLKQQLFEYNLMCQIVLLCVNPFELIFIGQRHTEDLRTFIQANKYIKFFRKIPHHKY
ncbi:unnamed protein product [Paramecium octaurelia]|uniref:Uncharacterized protein n=1 Tax=Paramecium octaurelia TaxID=43137 RepID=A0A8S1VTN6_PAROT|nr:unnamed protein product [Paramecium octaurelia]